MERFGCCWATARTIYTTVCEAKKIGRNHFPLELSSIKIWFVDQYSIRLTGRHALYFIFQYASRVMSCDTVVITYLANPYSCYTITVGGFSFPSSEKYIKTSRLYKSSAKVLVPAAKHGSV